MDGRNSKIDYENGCVLINVRKILRMRVYNTVQGEFDIVGKLKAIDSFEEDSERFGVDVPEGYVFFPANLGGLDLKNPFITLELIQNSIIKKPESVMEWFFREEHADYLRAKVNYEKVIVPAQEKLSKKDLAKLKFAGASFMPFAEFCLHREQTSEILYRAYKSLMREPAEQAVKFTPDIRVALSRKDWDDDTHYHQRVIQLYADDIIPRFSGLKIVQQGWLPTGMVSMSRESRF